MSLDDLNKEAQRRFDKIKNDWTGQIKKVLDEPDIEVVGKKIDVKKIQEMLDTPIEEYTNDGGIIKDNKSASIPNTVMDFIDSLNLPPNLSIAIAYIITSRDKGKLDNLQVARTFIEKEIDKC